MPNLDFEIRYINLDKDVRKKEQMETFCQALGFPYRRYSAFNGEQYTNDYFPMVDINYKNPVSWLNTTKGELGCALSHYALWSEISNNNKLVLIFEDDVATGDKEIIEKMKTAINEARAAMQSQYELCYLGRQPRQPKKESLIEVAPNFVKPRYSWLLHAYMLTPDGAKKLLMPRLLQNIIPADELVPYVIGEGFDPQLLLKYGPPTKEEKINAISYVENHLFWPTHELPSRTSNSKSFFKDGVDPAEQNFILATIGTDPTNIGFKFLVHSTSRNDWDKAFNIGDDAIWKGGDMKSPGGGQKINILRSYLEKEKLSDDTILVFVDGYDVIVNDSPYNVIRRWLENFDTEKVLFAAEKSCWPSRKISREQQKKTQATNGYDFLNSGCFIGKVGTIKKIIQEPIDDSDDDQLYYQIQYLDHQRIELDKDCKIFQCLSESVDEIDIDPETGQIFNNVNRSSPQIIHGNGGEDTKAVFLTMAQFIDDIHQPKEFKRSVGV